MVFISDAEALDCTSTITIYAQQLHQLGQVIFNYTGEKNADYTALVTKLKIATERIESNMRDLKLLADKL